MSHTHIQHWPSVWRTCIIDVYPDFFSFTSILTSYENARKRLKQHFLTTRTNNLWLYFFQKGIVFTKRRISNFIAPNKPRKWSIPFKTHGILQWPSVFCTDGQKGLFHFSRACNIVEQKVKNYALYACMMYKCGHGLNLFSLVRIQLY